MLVAMRIPVGRILLALTCIAGCSESGGGSGAGGYEKVKEWLCCIPGDAGSSAPAAWCDCAAQRQGEAADCSGREVKACPSASQCVVQGSNDDWSCACSDDVQALPAGSDVHRVDHCPP